ncbi:phage tail sheath family protein [Streptomyces sp. BR1]|uniref:phage tail sheath family protein n=1 Tax=Streptomyces sp. BR1 TaxID=1592323 RepID=UPI00402BB390
MPTPPPENPAPGVYVGEVSGGVRTITAAGTSTPAFLGWSGSKHNVTGPELVRSWAEFEESWDVPGVLAEIEDKPESEHGKLAGYLLMAEAVYGFFANGGQSCYVVPVAMGDDGYAKALRDLELIPDVSMIAAPALGSPDEHDTVARLMADHCKKMGNRMAILSIPPDAEPPKLDDARSFVAVYTPWLKAPGIDGRSRQVSPVGHIAGLWARTDSERGVHKAPGDMSLKEVLEPVRALDDKESAELADAGVNIVRDFPGKGPTVWGARTLSNEADWKYLNVRRLTCFLADSIKRSADWAVFEPNDHHLWAALRQSVTAFLDEQWRQGALMGSTPKEAFYVICDETNNDQRAISRGEVHVDISIAPVRPAEFVHFRITQLAGQSR